MQKIALCILVFCTLNYTYAQKKKETKFSVLGYYAGDTIRINNYPVEKLTHLIFCFGHLNGSRFYLNRHTDTVLIKKMVALKQKNPALKVILSLGGWGGCQPCSDIFATDTGRVIFANSVKEYLDYFKADGIDLDWEYPSVEGFPGHHYLAADKDNFVLLVKQLRMVLGQQKEISFAAGGTTVCLENSIDWKRTMPYVNRVNLMSYDLVSGFSKVSGHQTPLYSTPQQIESTDNGVKYLLSINVPASKIVIGAAFYARIFEVTDTVNGGLYRPCRFIAGVPYKNFDSTFIIAPGYTYRFDTIAKAPYYWNAQRKWIATFDDTTSIHLKTKYAYKKGLNGIMFWQLGEDKFSGGLLDVIDKIVTGYKLPVKSKQ